VGESAGPRVLVSEGACTVQGREMVGSVRRPMEAGPCTGRWRIPPSSPVAAAQL
jgi:hypothetical protein